jgi:hypothetical protein
VIDRLYRFHFTNWRFRTSFFGVVFAVVFLYGVINELGFNRGLDRVAPEDAILAAVLVLVLPVLIPSPLPRQVQHKQYQPRQLIVGVPGRWFFSKAWRVLPFLYVVYQALSGEYPIGAAFFVKGAVGVAASVALWFVTDPQKGHEEQGRSGPPIN